MLNNSDIEWLKERYPTLSVSEDQTVIDGAISFDASYDSTKKKNPFTLIGSDDTKEYTGIRLSGEFNVSIKLKKSSTELPTLTVLDDIPKETKRHFNTQNGVACVCGPIEELLFARNFNLPDYLEIYVISFLYGQLYYDQHDEWPWGEYSHCTLGILESYYLRDGTEFLDLIIQKLKSQTVDWKVLEAILEKKSLPKGHTPCFCDKGDFIRRCHPDAWEGLKKLYADTHDRNINF